MADIEVLTSPYDCTPYAPVRKLPRRVIGVCARAYAVAGELILISAVQSQAGQTELELSIGARHAQVVLSGDIPAYVIDDMIAELGGEYTPGLAHNIAAELNSELRYARYSEELKAGRLARDLAELPGRSKLLAKLLQVTI
mgnify:CR=1 FL=1